MNEDKISREGLEDPYKEAMEETPLLLQYWHAVLRHKIAIAIIVILCLLAGVVATLLMTPYYTATSRIEISREQENVTNVKGLEADTVGQNLEFYQTQYSLLEARSLAERVVRSQRLAMDSQFFDAFDVDPENSGLLSAQNSGGQKNISSSERALRLRLATDILLEHISISPIRGSSLVDINFSSPDPNLSARIANAWVEEFIAENLDRRFSSTADARKFLEEQLATLKAKLEDSERNLATYADNRQIVTLSTERNAEGNTVSQKTLATSNLETLNAALAEATADRITAESAARQSSGNENALANTALNNLREARAEAQSEYNKLMVQFEPGYPAAKALESKISSLSKSIAAEETRSKSGTLARYNEAKNRELELQRKVNGLKGEFSGERRDAIQYGILQREVDTNRQLYDGLLQRYKEIGVAGVGSNNISIVDAANPPQKPSSPKLLLNVALAILAGMGLAAAYVFVREQIDQTIKDSAELKTKLGISPLGAIPDADKEDVIESLKDKKSVIWEAYLSIRTNLAFLTDHGVPRSFLLTSTRPNEGKSTSAFALASVLASTGKRVVLIDGDMRNASLHRLLSVQNTAGLSNYLSGTDDVKSLVQGTNEFGFDSILAGPIPPNAAELLSSDRMREFVAKLQEIYDIVIVDAPPVLGLADIPLLATAVEGVVYTVEANGVKVRDLQSALRRVRDSRARIFGGIITKTTRQNSGYGYDYAYQYSYGGAKSNS